MSHQWIIGQTSDEYGTVVIWLVEFYKMSSKCFVFFNDPPSNNMKPSDQSSKMMCLHRLYGCIGRSMQDSLM